MKILALDTATEACSVALLVEGGLIARELEFERGHAEHILSMVDEVLVEGGLALASLDALAFGRGPGGFTGVRLAASVAQGLAFAAGLRVVPVSDLAAVAQRALDFESALTRVLVCNDARMQEVYWACFERGAHGLAGAVGAEHVGPPGTVVLPPEWCAEAGVVVGGAGRGFRAYAELRTRLLEPASGTGPHVAGPGARSEAEAVRPADGEALRPGEGAAPPPAAHDGLRSAEGEGLRPPVRLISDQVLPRAHEIARLAVAEVQAGRLLPPEEAIPVYLRDDVARPASSRN